MHEHLQEAVKKIIEQLVCGNYSEVESITGGIRINAIDMQRAIGNYGCKLIMPPVNGFDLLDVLPVQNSDPPRWSVTIPLWTQEEGRSDLSIELTLILGKNGVIIEFDDIRVL